ncbi:MAG: hypothetical protein ACRDSH_12855, partial [Pseudonocardiaceae bacterium]
GEGNTFWVIPSEFTSALQGVSRAFSEALPKSSATRETDSSHEPSARAAQDAARAAEAAAEAVADASEVDGLRQITSGDTPTNQRVADPQKQQPHHPEG